MSYSNPPPRKSSRRLSTSVRLGAAAVAACFISAQVHANPVNPTVVSGTASFSQAANVLTVTNSNGAIINWDKFSIKAGETTHFAQTAASSTVLNRVLNDPTAIYGTLSSNGRVWLVNPAGIMVGPGGRVDTAGFVASTLNIRNEDFLAGRKLFENTPGAGNVINQGEIRTPAGGSVYLIGSNVSNEGIITTPNGETILAAGATVSLIDSATPGVKVDITGAAGNATNLDTIAAEAGRIGIVGVIVRNSGTLNASSVVNEGGRVFLKASQDAYVDGNGRIITTGTRGGSVEVLGNRVAVMGSAEIDASGTNGGGSIKVGGDYQGKNPEVQNANISYFGPDASLKADATGVGAGGTVIVWADDTTRAYGSISARGGAAGGDGGLVETSGKRYLDVAGIKVRADSQNGTAGSWLLDPYSLTITGSATNASALGGPPYSFTSGIGGSNVLNTDIQAQLNNGTSVTLQTSGVAGDGFGDGDITVGANIAKTGGGAATLKLKAHNNILVSSGVSINSTVAALNVELNSDSDAVGGGGIHLAAGSSISSNGGNIVMGGGVNPLVTYARGNTTTTGGVGFNSGIYILGDITAGAGTVTLRGEGANGNFADGITFAGGTLSSNGIVTIDGLSHHYSNGTGDPNNQFAAGVNFFNAGVRLTTQTGTVTVTGVNAAPNADPIFYRAQGITVETGAVVETTGSGTLTFNGTANSLNTSWGVGVLGTIRSTASGGGAIAITGTNASINPDGGVVILGGSVLSSGGAISITGAGAGGAVGIHAGSIIGGAASGDILIKSGSVGSNNNGSIVIENSSVSSGPGSVTLAAYGGGTATGNINITGSNINVGGGFKALAGWDGTGFNGSDVIAGTGNIIISGSSINASGEIDLHAGNDITLGHTGTGPGTWIQSNGQMSVSANNLSLLGGDGVAWSDSRLQGPGVMLRGNGGQTIAVANQILLQAGSFDNTAYAGSPQYGGSVSIDSGGTQDISATTIKVYAGASGHDNGAQIQAYGSQSITINGGLLKVKGGGDDSSEVYGGAGSFNNQARIQHGQTYGGDVYYGAGVQTITINGGGTVIVQAGNGTGELGYYSNECALVFSVAACRGSSNGAQIENGLGAQTLDFLAPGSLTVTGGNGGTQNWAGINNKGAGQSVYGSPNITLSGGNSGGSGLGSGIQSFELSNDAGIFSKGSGGQHITAGNLTINAGNAAYGGAGISSESGNAIQIVTTGNLSMNGGGSSAGHPFASGVYIGSKGNVAIDLSIGGNLDIVSGYGTSSPVLIGSLDGTATVTIVSAGSATIVANGSAVGIGSGAPNVGPNVGIGTGVSLTATGGYVSISARDDVGIAGRVTATSGNINVDGGEGGYGGNIFVAGTLSGNSGVTLRAHEAWLDGSKGHVVQTGGSIISAPNGDIHISGGGDVTLDGSVTASNGIDVGSGFDGGNGYFSEGYGYGNSSALGGNLIIGGILGSTAGDINLAANVGYEPPYGKGNITQRSGSSIGGTGSIGIFAGGSVDLGGTVTSSAGSLSVFAGNQVAYAPPADMSSANGGYLTLNGGNISVAGTLSGKYGVSLFAEAGIYSGLNGHVTQSSGSISSGYGDIRIGGGGHVTLHGSISSIFGYGTFIASGRGDSGSPSQLGGNIMLGAGSQIFGDHVEMVASGGYSGGLGAGGESTGNITQHAGGILRATANNPPVTTLIAHAAGNVELLGTTIVDGGTPVMIKAGYDSPVNQYLSGRHITINSLNAAGSSVELDASGQIFANTQDVASIFASIGSNSASGGIIVKNFGAAQPAFVNLYDNAPANSTVSFSHAGSDLTLDSSYYFSTFGNAGAIFVAAPSNNLTYSGGGLYGGSTILTAGSNLTIDSNLSTSGDIRLFAGNALTVNSGVVAGNNIGLIAPEIILNAGVTASGTAATPSVISNPVTGAAVAFSGIGFIAKNLYADSASGYLKATQATGDVSGLVAGNITLKNGAHFQAGNDIDLTLTGVASTLSLDNGSYLLADAVTHVPTSIWLAFTSRSSGGVMIDGLETTKSTVGGSGLFVGDLNTPATDGAGLHLTYAAAKVTVDPCVVNPTLCKLPDLDRTPINQDAPPVLLDAFATDPTKPPEDLSKTAGGTEGTFGGEEGGKEEKKDEKDDKDKKSDKSKDEKKDEKSAQKKVGKCEV